MKITLTRVLEISKILATDIGQKIPDFFNYMAEFVEQMVRSLRNGLTFQDNFDCSERIVKLLHNTPQVISSTRAVRAIQIQRVYSQTVSWTALSWYYDDQGNLTIKLGLDPDPGTSTIDVMILILF